MLKATMGLAAAVNRGAQDDVDLGGGPRLSSVSLMVREEGRGETPRSGGGWNPSRGVGGVGWGRLEVGFDWGKKRKGRWGSIGEKIDRGSVDWALLANDQGAFVLVFF